jgi:hypothetical protein
MDQRSYFKQFPSEKREKALLQALDIRKFEIDLYWKRAAYFWTLIAAAFAGYVALLSKDDFSDKEFVVLVVACLGLLFSFAWSCVNRGSKQWQENWENHVDMLEDDVIGPLYKIVLRRRPPENKWEWVINAMTGPGTYSVSGINQIISTFMVLLWVVLVARSLHLDLSTKIDFLASSVVLATVLACISFVVISRTHVGNHEHLAKLRSSKINSAP